MDARFLARWAGAACLVIAPLAFTIASFFPTYSQDDPIPRQLADIAAAPHAIATTNLLGVPILLIVPAMLFVAMLIRRGAPRLSVIGGAISLFAWLAGMVAFGTQGIVYESAAAVPDRLAAVAVLDATNANPTFNALVLSFVAGHLIGMVILGIGVRRARMRRPG